MNTLKELAKLLAFCAIITISFTSGYYASKAVKIVYVERKYIPTRIELQESLGVKPDGKIGPITEAAWQKAEQERFNEIAEEYF